MVLITEDKLTKPTDMTVTIHHTRLNSLMMMMTHCKL